MISHYSFSWTNLKGSTFWLLQPASWIISSLHSGKLLPFKNRQPAPLDTNKMPKLPADIYMSEEIWSLLFWVFLVESTRYAFHNYGGCMFPLFLLRCKRFALSKIVYVMFHQDICFRNGKSQPEADLQYPKIVYVMFHQDVRFHNGKSQLEASTLPFKHFFKRNIYVFRDYLDENLLCFWHLQLFAPYR